MGKLRTVSLILGILFVSFTAQIVYSHSANAVSANEFQAGRIIDDNVFYNTGSFSGPQAVQDFIKSHTPVCDTWGTQPSGYGSLNRAQYAQQIKGWAGPPYVCLQNYHENPSTGQTSYEMGGGSFAGGINAGQIIWDAAQQNGINPQVLLVLLKKESAGPLFSDSWPTKSQYKYAMGYGCPDSGPNYSAACVDSKAGFYKQVNLAAWQLKRYATNISEYNYQPGRWNYIQYSPDPNCGGRSVYIDNVATASLYIYTPYTPNQGSLNAYPGTSSCGSYGNRNFFMFFNEWFGSTYGSVNIASPLSVSSGLAQGLFTNNTITAQFTIKNNSSQRQNIGTMAIGVKNQNNANFDFGSQEIVLEPWQTYTYRSTRLLNVEGKYTFSIINHRESAGWSTDFPSSLGTYTRTISNATVMNIPTLSAEPIVDTNRMHIGQSSNVRMTIKNNSNLYTVNLGYFGLAMFSPSGKNVDLPFDTVNSLAPGATYDYYKSFKPTESGTYVARVSATADNGLTWSEGYFPALPPTATSRTVNINVKSNPVLSQGMSMTQTDPYAGGDTTGSFSVKNYSDSAVTVNKNLCYIVRGPNNTNNDLGCLEIGTLNPGQELVFNGTRNFNLPGLYKGYFSMFDGKNWFDNWSFEKELGTEPITASFTIKDNPTLFEGLTLDDSSPRVGDNITGTFSVKNNSSKSVVVNKNLCYIVRGPNNSNHDLGCLEIKTLAPGQVSTFSASRKMLTSGRYSAYFSLFDGSEWRDDWSFAKNTESESTKLQFTVRQTPTLTQGMSISNTSPTAGSTVNGSFKIKNNSTTSVVVNKNLCYIVRGPNNSNHDLGCLAISTLNPGQEVTFNGGRVLNLAGSYRGYFSMYDGANWHDNWSFEKEVGTEPTAISLTVR